MLICEIHVPIIQIYDYFFYTSAAAEYIFIKCFFFHRILTFQNARGLVFRFFKTKTITNLAAWPLAVKISLSARQTQLTTYDNKDVRQLSRATCAPPLPFSPVLFLCRVFRVMI